MSTPGPASSTVLSLRDVSKAFGAVRALREVSVDCRAGEIHALVGENGSGKSTLLGISSGFLAPDHGTVEIAGKERRRVSPAETRRLGLGIAYQTYSHVLDLSVAESLYLGAPPELRPRYGRMEAWAAETLGAFDLDIPLTATTRSLSLVQRQLLEAVKPLSFLGNDLMVFHVLDRAELEFNYDDASSFEDLESGEQIPIVPEALSAQYRALMQEHINALTTKFSEHRIDYTMLNTALPLDHALFTYLAMREKLMRVR